MNLCTKCVHKMRNISLPETFLKPQASRSFFTGKVTKFVIPQKKSTLPPAETSVGSIALGCVCAGISVIYLYNQWETSESSPVFDEPLHPLKKPKTARERRFLQFGSLEYDGVIYMTPNDFIESVLEDEPRPRKKTRLVDHKLAERYVSNIPDKKYGSLYFFRDVGERGLISFPEYVFLLSIITQPRRSFKIGFELIDKNRNNQLSKEEFIEFISLVGGCPVHLNKKGFIGQEVNTTLLVHLFGKEGEDKVSLREFSRFVLNLQEELLHAEFKDYSRGTGKISEEDLATILLRYTTLPEATQEILVSQLHSRLPPRERVGITFPEYMTLMLLLNNVYELAVMLRMFHLAQRSVSKKQFTRAAQICLERVYEELAGGNIIPYTIHKHIQKDDIKEEGETNANREKLNLSPHIVDIIFYMLDKSNDGELNYECLISMIYDRKNKAVRTILNNEEWSGLKGFGKCIRNEIKLQKKEHELLRSYDYDDI